MALSHVAWAGSAQRPRTRSGSTEKPLVCDRAQLTESEAWPLTVALQAGGTSREGKGWVRGPPSRCCPPLPPPGSPLERDMDGRGGGTSPHSQSVPAPRGHVT